MTANTYLRAFPISPLFKPTCSRLSVLDRRAWVFEEIGVSTLHLSTETLAKQIERLKADRNETIWWWYSSSIWNHFRLDILRVDRNGTRVQ